MDPISLFLGGGIIQLIVQLLVGISSAILMVSGSILSWVCSENFVSLPYTSGKIVETSWALTRDFTNMFFIVVLVFIGLATALRIREYEVKKTLPLLIIIAILINFTPVICGFIVDAANILMHFFIKNVSGAEIIGAQLSNYYNDLKNDLLSINALNPFKHLEYLLRGIILIMFNTVATFIFFAFSFLFIIRYVAIWMLVILSPFAFFSYILPATRKVWNMWWNQFIQWTFIGVTGGFFLYIGMQTSIILLSKEVEGKLGEVGGNWLLDFIGVSDIINGTLAMGISLAFLLLAFFMGLSTGAMGGDAIMGGFKRAGKAMGTQIRTESFSGARGVFNRARSFNSAVRTSRAAQLAWAGPTSRWSRARNYITSTIRAVPVGIRNARIGGPLTPQNIPPGGGPAGGGPAGGGPAGGGPAGGGPAGGGPPPLRGVSLRRDLGAAQRGVRGALGRILSAGWKAGIKAKKQKTGFKCPDCGKLQSQDRDFCENCGYKF